jgi:threonine dehydrogenase-like Zn-dependent dehydrogenase
MKAVVWHGKTNLSVDEVPDPKVEDPTDIILKVTTAAICGSDLHLYGGYIPTMEDGDIMGHEFMGEVVEKGSAVSHVEVGDRVVVPFNMACGDCFFCKRELYSLCDKTNRNYELAAKLMGYSPSGLFGYTHMLGGYPGGQAQYVRVPFAHFGVFKMPEGIPDEKLLFLGDILSTGYMAAENCTIQTDETVAIWGAGPVGLFAAKSAQLLGAKQIIIIDRVKERLTMAEANIPGVKAINFHESDKLIEELRDLTDGRGPDKTIDAVGLEAHSEGLQGMYDKAKHMVKAETDRIGALREIIINTRKGGTVSIAGVYGGVADKFPVGPMMNKALTIRQGQTHTHRYVKPLLARIESGDIDPSFVITHSLPISEAPNGYDMFREKKDGCIKVVLKPWG